MIQSVLLIGIDPQLNQTIRSTLRAGFHIMQVSTNESAQQSLNQVWFDLVVLSHENQDPSLQFDFIKDLIKTAPSFKSPIVVLGHNISTHEEIQYLISGATDVISYSSPLELIQARLLCAMATRFISRSVEKRIGDLVLDLADQKAYFVKGSSKEDLGLSSFEIKLVDYLLCHLDQIIPRDRFINDVWGSGVHVLDRTVDAHISRIRKKLGSCSHNILTVYGQGYRFQLVKPFSSKIRSELNI